MESRVSRGCGTGHGALTTARMPPVAEVVGKIIYLDGIELFNDRLQEWE